MTDSMADALTGDSAQDALTNHSAHALMHDAAPDAATDHSAADGDEDASTLYATHENVVTRHDAPVVVGLDWEKDGWRVSYGGTDPVKVSRDALLAETFEGVDHVVVENAHMRERNPYSVAQVYTEDELRRLPFKSRVRLFPSMPGQLAKAARDVGNVTEKLNDYGDPMPDKDKDAATMALYAMKHPRKLASWKKFRLPDEDPARHLWEARDAFRDDLREAMNPLRSAWNALSTADKYALPEVVDFCTVLDSIYDDLEDGIKEQFGIRRTRNGLRVDRMPAALTVYLSVYDREGNLRRDPQGRPIGTRFILKSIGLCNSYRPNMARSQLTHHGMRHYKGGRDGGYRSEYMRNLRRFIAALKNRPDVLTSDATLSTSPSPTERQSA